MNRGLVSLVGAGPGDPELLTLRAHNRLREADVVVYDRLIHPSLLELVPDHAERVFAGKTRGLHFLDQRSIEAVLIDRARQGKRVVRLKGGDPYVFGRGGEEVEALVAAGILYEVVPGITSAVSVPASANIPVTHRELSSSVTIVTGHEDPTKPETSVDWEWLARPSGTLVILMGLDRAGHICDRLIDAGLDPRTPGAIVSRGTLPDQRSVFGAVSELSALAEDAELQSPAIIVVGEVARFPAILESLAEESLAYAV
jgi:uroporphyrin-III C-methyltransferase